tara:strand:+ start:109 stop:606 length:498 start_codon:yes stop_codon:yes gene_type:complete
MSFKIGIPKRYYRRTTQVLSSERSTPIYYDAEKQDDGFYLFSFPHVDEYDFKDIIKLLNNNGVLTVGDDKILSEKKIMKLTDLLKEEPSPDENDLLDMVKNILEKSKKTRYRDDKEALENLQLDLEELIEDYEEEEVMDRPNFSDINEASKIKLKNLIRQVIKKQ